MLCFPHLINITYNVGYIIVSQPFFTDYGPHLNIFLCSLFGPGGYTQGVLLALHTDTTPGKLRGPFRMLWIEPGLEASKTNAISGVLSLHPSSLNNFDYLLWNLSNQVRYVT